MNIILVLIVGGVFLGGFLLSKYLSKKQFQEEQNRLNSLTKHSLNDELFSLYNKKDELNNKIEELETEVLVYKQRELQKINEYCDEYKKSKLDTDLSAAALEIEEWKSSAQEAADEYMNLIHNSNNEKINEYNKEITYLKNELDDFHKKREVMNEAIRIENEMNNEFDVHSIHLSNNDKNDIEFLLSLETKLHNPQILYKLIWTEYIQKPFNEMIFRICGSKNPRNIIYCIENIETKQKYIGKTASDYKTRMTNHIKSSLNIGTNASQRIHKALFKNWDKFMFTILEEVNNADLLEREKYYIEMFQSVEYGYNMQK